MGLPERWKTYAHQRETTGSSSDSLQLRPFSKWELLIKERICSQRKRILSFKSSSLWYGNSLWTTFGDLPWVLLFLVHTCITALWDLRQWVSYLFTCHWHLLSSAKNHYGTRSDPTKHWWPCADLGVGGLGVWTPPPLLKNHKNIGFLSNTGPGPMKNHKAACKASIQCWAIIGTPVKCHLNGILLVGRWWPAYSGIGFFLPSWTKTNKQKTLT